MVGRMGFRERASVAGLWRRLWWLATLAAAAAWRLGRGAALVVTLWVALAPDAGAQGGVATERAALEALYDATGGAGWRDNTNWKTSAPLGEWYGVTTDRGGRVTQLDLARNSLAGAIPDSLGNLANLEVLALFENELTGPIPEALARLSSLRYLGLSWNELTGPIPAGLGNLVNLQRLEISTNSLSGSIPDSLGNLRNLESLYLSGNELTGPLPARLGELTRLRRLFLDRNELTGPIPTQLGSLVNLERLYLSRNRLTGPIPARLGNLASLELLFLDGNRLTGAIPTSLGNLMRLRGARLDRNDLTGSLPAELGRLATLESLRLEYNWSLSGSLPPGLEGLQRANIFATQACAPAVVRNRLRDDFLGRSCGDATDATDVTIDVAVVYTPSARRTSGGTAEIEAVIDLMIAEANQAYEASGVSHRVALVSRSEVAYTEADDSFLDFDRFEDPLDGHMDEVHPLRERVGADLVHLIVDEGRSTLGGRANIGGPFGLSVHTGGGVVFAHELGHNMGLEHDRWQKLHYEGGAYPHPAYGYVNQRGFEAEASPDSRWLTIMSYHSQCYDTGDLYCTELLRFSNPRQRNGGDPLGVAHAGDGAAGLTGPADAAAVLDATGPAVASWRDPPSGSNRPPVAVGTLPDRRLAQNDTLTVDVSKALIDPDGDALRYTASSSAPHVVTVRAAGARVTLTALQVGAATIRVAATDPGGLSVEQSFTVTVRPFTDDPLVPGVTPVRTVHFTELRTRIDALRRAARLGPFSWTDPALTAGTPVRLVHLIELRSGLAQAYVAAGRPTPRWTDAAVAGKTPIRAVHLMELRTAVIALE